MESRQAALQLFAKTTQRDGLSFKDALPLRYRDISAWRFV